MRLGEPQNRSRRFGGNKNLLPLAGFILNKIFRPMHYVPLFRCCPVWAYAKAELVRISVRLCMFISASLISFHGLLASYPANNFLKRDEVASGFINTEATNKRFINTVLVTSCRVNWIKAVLKLIQWKVRTAIRVHLFSVLVQPRAQGGQMNDVQTVAVADTR